MRPGTFFSLEFINSIYLAPVQEVFLYDPHRGVTMVMVQSPSYGVFEYYGLQPDETGRAYLHRKMGNIRIRTPDYEHCRISVGGMVLLLKGLVPDGESLVVRVREHGACGD